MTSAISSDTAGTIACYSDDTAGPRARMVVVRESVQEERIYVGSYEVWRKRSTGVLTQERQTLHIMDGRRHIAMVEPLTVNERSPPETPSTRVRDQLGDHPGTAALEPDEAGAVISYEEYPPYGSTAWHADDGGLDGSPKRYKYTGMERDDETGLQRHFYCRREYLHPELIAHEVVHNMLPNETEDAPIAIGRQFSLTDRTTLPIDTFLQEGLTEYVARSLRPFELGARRSREVLPSLLRRSLPDIYPEPYAFWKAIEKSVGEEAIIRAALSGDFAQIRPAITEQIGHQFNIVQGGADLPSTITTPSPDAQPPSRLRVRPYPQ